MKTENKRKKHKRGMKGSTEVKINYKRNSYELRQTKGWENKSTGKCQKLGAHSAAFS